MSIEKFLSVALLLLVVASCCGGAFWFLQTNDFWRGYKQIKANGVQFNEGPREEVYGTVVVFEDLYRNHWDLLGLKNRPDRDRPSAG
jgi:hypothetical protein